MFIKDNKINREIVNGSLREKFVRDVNNSLVIIKTYIPKEEILRKELLEKIKRGELTIPA
jgi:hypothetical protein